MVFAAFPDACRGSGKQALPVQSVPQVLAPSPGSDYEHIQWLLLGLRHSEECRLKPCLLLKRQVRIDSGLPVDCMIRWVGDVQAGCNDSSVVVQIPLSRSGKSGLSVTCTPVSDAGFFESEGSAGSRLTASNLTEFDNLQRQVSRKDKPRSPLHGEPRAVLAD